MRVAKPCCGPTFLDHLLLNRIAMSDQEIKELEARFPAVSGQAFAQARERVLASGQSILESRDGVLFEVFPDGRRVPLKTIAPPVPAVPGSIREIR